MARRLIRIQRTGDACRGETSNYGEFRTVPHCDVKKVADAAAHMLNAAGVPCETREYTIEDAEEAELADLSSIIELVDGGPRWHTK